MLKNPEKTKNEIVQWIRDYFAENGPTCSAVVGVSGGKDSSVTAALCAEALGADRVVGVLMPNGVQPDIEDSRELVAAIGIPFVELNIEEAFQGMKHMLEGSEKLAEITGRTELSNDTRINLPPRLRMATLYAVGQMLPNGARVANTCIRRRRRRLQPAGPPVCGRSPADRRGARPARETREEDALRRPVRCGR